MGKSINLPKGEKNILPLVKLIFRYGQPDRDDYGSIFVVMS
jgi:hypothetical protein